MGQHHSFVFGITRYDPIENHHETCTEKIKKRPKLIVLEVRWTGVDELEQFNEWFMSPPTPSLQPPKSC